VQASPSRAAGASGGSVLPFATAQQFIFATAQQFIFATAQQFIFATAQQFIFSRARRDDGRR
jgi:7-keto-8-aminopelargonate synthetase-like enzyme